MKTKLLTELILQYIILNARKFRLSLIIILVFLGLIDCDNSPKNETSIYELKCEYLVNPIGLDVKTPRLNWKIKDQRRGVIQKAYKISVGTDSTKVAKGKGSYWSTGKVKSDDQMVVYSGKQLQPFKKYYWTVSIWDKDNNLVQASQTASFEMGMIESRNWKGSWISDSRDIDKKESPYFRKEFKIEKKVKKARVYIAVAGLYELYINGKRIGDHQLDPTFTRFDRRNLYVTHDVTSFLEQKNAIGVLLGNGWFNHQSTAVWYFHEAPWRARPMFCLDLKVTYEDGSEQTFSSNTDWKNSSGGLLFNSIYTAEHFNALQEQKGWNIYGFDDLN